MTRLGLVPTLAAAIFAAACVWFALPGEAVVVDPRVGTTTEPAPVAEQTPRQVEEQMQNPAVVHPVAPAQATGERGEAPEFPPSADPQAVLAVASGSQTGSEDNSPASSKQNRPNHLVGLAVAAAVLGLCCVAAMVAVKKGTRRPTRGNRAGKE